MIEQHRTMEVPGAGIVRDGGPTTQHSEYPKHMRHPGFQRGKPDKEIKLTDENGRPTGGLAYVGGESIRFPPVLVWNESQEQGHQSQGYETVGKSDPAAFARLVADAEPVQDNYKPIEFPKWSHGKLVRDAAEEADHLAALGIDKMGRPVESVVMTERDTSVSDIVASAVQDIEIALAAELNPPSEEDEIAALEAKLAVLKAKKAVPVVEARIKEALGPTCTEVTEVIEGVDKIHAERLAEEKTAAEAKEARNAARVAKIKATFVRKKAEKAAAETAKALRDEVHAEAEGEE